MRFNAEHFIFVRCFNENACLRGEELTNCNNGYRGIMCTSCSDNYWKNFGTYQCYECSQAMSPGLIYFFKVVFFALTCYLISRFLLQSLNKQNQETVAAIRILLTFTQLMTILSKMDNMSSKNLGELSLQQLLDKLLYYVCPEQWIFDFDCLVSGKSPEDAYLLRLLVTVFMPLPLIVIDIVMIWIITFIIKLMKKKTENDPPTRLDCGKLCNRFSIAFSIQMFLILPVIMYTLFSSLQCFESLDENKEDMESLERMVIVPEITCDSSAYTQIKYGIIVPAICVYMVFIPFASIRSIVFNSHWIFHSGRDYEKLDSEEKKNVINAKSSFGFYFRGLNTNQIVKRKLREDDFLIENVGTYREPEFAPFKICGQWIREKFLQFVWHPVSGKAMLVRINPSLVAKSYFYWEVVLFVEKFILILMATSFGQELNMIQLSLVMIILGVFMGIQSINAPYFTTRLNKFHKATLLTCIWYINCRIIMRVLN